MVSINEPSLIPGMDDTRLSINPSFLGDNLSTFVFALRLLWILSTQRVSLYKLCYLVGVCWWWQENLDIFGLMGMYCGNLGDWWETFCFVRFLILFCWTAEAMSCACTSNYMGTNHLGCMQRFSLFCFLFNVLPFYSKKILNLKKKFKCNRANL